MEEIRTWIRFGKRVGLNPSKFLCLKAKILTNIENIQAEISKIIIIISSTPNLSEELQLLYSSRIILAEKTLAKQNDFFVLSSIQILLARINETIPFSNSKLTIKKSMKTCNDIKSQLKFYQDKLYSDIIILAEEEVDLILLRLKEKLELIVQINCLR